MPSAASVTSGNANGANANTASAERRGRRGKRVRSPARADALVDASGAAAFAGGAGARARPAACSSRRLSARRTRKRRPPIVVVSPRLGSRPNARSTSPPTVSNSSSGKPVPKCALKSAISVCAFTRNLPFASAMMLSWLSSKSYSSSMSPTICSSTSSIVTRPDTPPYSSTTMAMWLRLARKSRRSTLRRFDSGTNTAGRSVSRKSKLPGWRSSGGAPSRAGCR